MTPSSPAKATEAPHLATTLTEPADPSGEAVPSAETPAEDSTPLPSEVSPAAPSVNDPIAPGESAETRAEPTYSAEEDATDAHNVETSASPLPKPALTYDPVTGSVYHVRSGVDTHTQHDAETTSLAFPTESLPTDKSTSLDAIPSDDDKEPPTPSNSHPNSYPTSPNNPPNPDPDPESPTTTNALSILASAAKDALTTPTTSQILIPGTHRLIHNAPVTTIAGQTLSLNGEGLVVENPSTTTTYLLPELTGTDNGHAEPTDVVFTFGDKVVIAPLQIAPTTSASATPIHLITFEGETYTLNIPLPIPSNERITAGSDPASPSLPTNPTNPNPAQSTEQELGQTSGSTTSVGVGVGLGDKSTSARVGDLDGSGILGVSGLETSLPAVVVGKSSNGSGDGVGAAATATSAVGEGDFGNEGGDVGGESNTASVSSKGVGFAGWSCCCMVILLLW